MWCPVFRHASESQRTNGDVRRVGLIVRLVPADPEGLEMKARASGSRDVGRAAGRMKRKGRDGTTAEDMTVSIHDGTSRRRPSSIMLLLVVACWLLMAGQCASQKPINLGGSKKRDVYIAGFFPYGNHVPEGHIGRGVMPAVKLAVEHINEHPTILRDYRLHMWWNDTEVSFSSCDLSGTANRDLILRGLLQ